MYQKILNEAVQELKETEFKGTYINDESDSFYMEDCQIDTDMEILIPDHYVNSISERLQLYKDLNALQNEIDLHLFEEQITDRFGPIPETVKRLSDSIRLRWIAKELGFEKIILKNQKMIAYFIANPQSIFFESRQFSGVLDFIQKNPKTCKMKERNNKLSMVFQGIRKIHTAICVLKEIQSSLDPSKLRN
jgi:transcription-repair coupling factor (superfamily II helicase)